MTPKTSGAPMMNAAAPFAAYATPTMISTTIPISPISAQRARAARLQDGEADQGKQPAADPLPRFTDGDAGPEYRPPDHDGQHPAQQDRREPGGDGARKAGGRRPEERARRRLLALQRPQ